MVLTEIFTWTGIISVTIIVGGIIGFSSYKFYTKMSNKIKHNREQQQSKTVASDYDDVFKTIKTLDKAPNKVHSKKETVLSDPESSFPEAEKLMIYDVKGGRFLKKKQRKQMDKVLKRFQDSAVYIVFQTTNNKYKTWVQEDHDSGFTYKKKKYVFDPDSKVHFMDMNMYGYFFQEQVDIPINKSLKLNDKVLDLINAVQTQIDSEFSKPIDKQISISEVKDAIEVYGLAEVESAFEPESLKRFIDTQVILQVMGGAWFTKIMKIVLIMNVVMSFLLLIIAFAVGYVAFYTYKFSASGVFG